MMPGAHKGMKEDEDAVGAELTAGVLGGYHAVANACQFSHHISYYLTRVDAFTLTQMQSLTL